MTKLAPPPPPEWVQTSDPMIRSPACYRWTTAPACRKEGQEIALEKHYKLECQQSDMA